VLDKRRKRSERGNVNRKGGGLRNGFNLGQTGLIKTKRVPFGQTNLVKSGRDEFNLDNIGRNWFRLIKKVQS
jgi:hypothetical protein